jgi:hypothetical protein
VRARELTQQEDHDECEQEDTRLDSACPIGIVGKNGQIFPPCFGKQGGNDIQSGYCTVKLVLAPMVEALFVVGVTLACT